MTADKEPRSPLDCWAAKASREVMFVMMLGWNLDGREGNQARMEPVCWGWRSRQWARAEAPHILLPLTQGVRDNVKVYWSGKCATDKHRHRSLPQDAGWCPGVSSAGIPSPPMAALSQTACGLLRPSFAREMPLPEKGFVFSIQNKFVLESFWLFQIHN